MSALRLLVVNVVHAADAIDAARRQCTAVLLSTDVRCIHADRPEAPAFMRQQLYVLPLPDSGPTAHAVLCRTHFDQIRREDRKAAKAQAAAFAADTQTTLF